MLSASLDKLKSVIPSLPGSLGTIVPLESEPLDIPVPDVVDLGSKITTFERVHEAKNPGSALRLARLAAADFRREFAATGKPTNASTHDLITLPYPTKFGLYRAGISPSPFLFLTNRLVVVRWTESNGKVKTMLWEPSDAELDANTPYFAALLRSTPSAVADRLSTTHSTVLEALAKIGLDPADVDYLAFDHLHTQDVRRLIGTTKPQADISPSAPVAAQFPNARLIVQREELEAMRDLHPLQRPWYQPETFLDIDPKKLLPIDGDRLLGPGVAVVRTPGHALGNQTLVLNTDTGIWALSENMIAAELLNPNLSKIPGIANWAKTWGQEVIINANTIEATAQQYNFCVLEKSLVDRAQADERFLQFFPTSELTASHFAPGTRPTFAHGSFNHGSL